MTTETLNIVLVEDHRLVRHGLRLILNATPGLQVVAEATSAETAVEQVRNHLPDLVLLDIHLPGPNGIELARNLLAEFPNLLIIALSADSDLATVHAALQAGVVGYLTKDTASEEIQHAIQTVRDHRVYLCPDVASLVVSDYFKGGTKSAAPQKPSLSERELQVLRLVAAGKRNKEIASTLSVGVKSVETYRSRLMRKLSCSTAAELTRYAIREGITPL